MLEVTSRTHGWVKIGSQVLSPVPGHWEGVLLLQIALESLYSQGLGQKEK